MKQLVVNADDFGFTRDVNRGIVKAHTDGILTATTLMANGDAFDDAISLSRDNPALDIGCHLVLIGGRSLVNPDRRLPASIREMAQAVLLRRLNPYEEFRAQVEKILAAGVTPTHLDTHKHTHLLPRVLEAVARLSEEYSIRWVRRPFDFPMTAYSESVPAVKRMTSQSLTMVRRRFHTVLEKHGCRTTDHFAGFQITGRFGATELQTLFRELPDGSTEFMCHPGFCTPELISAQTRLKESRELELQALTDPMVRRTLGQLGVTIVNYRDLAAGRFSR
ncbi:MAG: ChbG/HpnK family deacetylase [Bryobacteraceae bacterium]